MEASPERKIKSVAFNLSTELDVYEFANSLSNFSNWVKEQIRDELYGKRCKILTQAQTIVQNTPTLMPSSVLQQTQSDDDMLI